MEKLSPQQITILATSFANSLCNSKTIAELVVIRNISSQICSVINTFLAVETMQEISHFEKIIDTKK